MPVGGIGLKTVMFLGLELLFLASGTPCHSWTLVHSFSMTNCDACDPYYTAPMQELEQKEEGGHLVHTPLYMQ